ncbi:CotH kinase family protein [Lewinella sp. 4G2]|uniref:CotH kinase family protein n=1 Tax=Lewinella sp. 4G2 TaxID=1803372 RepID=UPI0007B4B65F|nr:CotH kinase family protein [Lewinella sp. 4G2]OAV43783.1 hypothetical protein A3850_004400 [Lewinella sp. 4G2]
MKPSIPILKANRMTLVVLYLLLASQTAVAQTDFTSTLPILIIDTDGQGIQDEPKVTARLGVIDNGPGQTNRPTDDWNEYDGFIGIEGRGSSSQALFPKIGYGFETRDADGEDRQVSLLGFPKEEDWILHGPYSDKSLIRNALTYHLAGQFMAWAPRVRMVEVIIDGDYRGVYLFTERIKRDKNRIDIAKLSEDENAGDDLTGGYIIKIDKPTGEAGDKPFFFTSDFRAGTMRQWAITYLYHYPKPDDITAEQRTYIQGFMADFEGALAGDDFLEPISGYKPFVDLQSFVDFFIVNELTRNVDGYRISTYLYKDKDSNDARLKMGSVWDFNIALGNANYCQGANTAGWAIDFNIVCDYDQRQVPFWWKRMLEDPAFVTLLQERWTELRRSHLSNGQVFGTIDSLTAEMTDAVDRNFERWPVLEGKYVWPNAFQGRTYASEVAYLEGWLTERLAWLDAAIPALETGLPEEVDPIMILSPNPTAGIAYFNNFSESELELVEVYSATGQLLQSVTHPPVNSGVDLSGYPSGTYVVLAVLKGGDVRYDRVVRR